MSFRNNKAIIFICILAASIIYSPIFGQNNTLYTHYYFNPYLLNPAYAGQKGYTSLTLNYRQQWAGIDGAPQTSNLNFLYPIDHKMSLGIAAQNDKRGVLNTTRAVATFGYSIYFGQTPSIYNHLSFGLSAGVNNTSIDLDAVDNLNDPAISNVLDNNYSATGAFGVYYQYKQLQLGFALPRLFKTDLVSTDKFNFNEIQVEQLKYTVTSLRYKFRLGYNLALEPWLLYRTSNGFDGQAEGLAVLHIKDLAWVGGGYRQNYSAFFMLGLKISDKLEVGYGYEMADAQVPNIGQGTHEFQIAFKLGKKNKLAEVMPSDITVPEMLPPTASNELNDAPEEGEEEEIRAEEPSIEEETLNNPGPKENGENMASNEPENTVKQTEPVEQPPAVPETGQNINNQAEAPANSEAEKADENPVPEEYVNQSGMAPGHYVIVGAFEYEKNAKKYARGLTKDGYDVEIHFHDIKQYYYVSFPAKNNLFTARQLLRRIRAVKIADLPKAWILTIK